jgi:DNA repair exonuclease SbcCD ATPase subunit
MSIMFKRIAWQNFLSTGNAFTEVPLNQHTTTLIVGENGSGKSTILDAICFALFGKPYRNINKPQLVNSINTKNCLVELEFDIGSRQYLIRRGIKPSVFEIYENGVFLDQDAATKDYQRYLEETILKLNYKSFTQIVILGSTSFTPFMQLPAAARREIIEDLLDIKIFSQMNATLKEKVSAMKSKMTDLENGLDLTKKKIQLQQTFIKTLEDDRANKIYSLQKQVDQNRADISLRQTALVDLMQQKTDLVAQTVESDSIANELQQHIYAIRRIESQIDDVQDEVDFFHENDSCPKCKQTIDSVFKKSILDVQANTLHELADRKTVIENQQATVKQMVDHMKALQAQIQKMDSQIMATNLDITMLEKMNQRLFTELSDVQKKVANIKVEQGKLQELKQRGVSLYKERSELHELGKYYDIAALLLKDSGIKTTVIRKYIPIFNNLINTYLTSMDFFIQFTLNEKFEESIKSRHRDDFSYESFSEGEKQRIDLALLFTWRTVAKMKNSINTNLLILDEVFDSSLDANGTEHIMALLKTVEKDTNIFVISHKGDAFFDKFNHSIRFAKRQNFSTII